MIVIDMIVVSIRAHQYKLALRRQVLHIGGTKNRAQQYKLALRQRVMKFTTCYSNVNETYQDALRHIIYIYLSGDAMYLMYQSICNNISFIRM
jgi:hypothetical protein